MPCPCGTGCKCATEGQTGKCGCGAGCKCASGGGGCDKGSCGK